MRIAKIRQASLCRIMPVVALAMLSLSSLPSASGQVNFAQRWATTATDGGTGPLGDPITLTWSIVEDGQAIANRTSDMISRLDTMWAVSAADQMSTDYTMRPWFARFEAGFNRWGQVSGLTYTYEPNDDGAAWGSTGGPTPIGDPAPGITGVRGDVRIGGFDFNNNGSLAQNQFPLQGGNMRINTAQSGAFGINSDVFFRNIISHEAGHGFGLLHTSPSGERFLMNPSLGTSFDGPQTHDILAAQRGYGDALEKNGGNDSLATATALGNIAINSATVGRGLDTPDGGENPTGITPAQTDFISIDDDSDTDYFRFSVSGRSQANFLINPRGPTYNVALDGQTPSPFNASNRSDLAFAVYDQNGIRLSQVDNTGIGGNEQVAGFKLPEAGDYFVQVTGKGNETQLYSVELDVNSSQAVVDPSVVFRDTFDIADGNTNPNAFRQGAARQGPGIVDSLIETSSTGSAGNTSVEVIDNALQLSSTGDGASPNRAFADLNRNFAPQLDGEMWNLNFDVSLESDVLAGDSWFALVFNDDQPVGVPFSDAAELAILLRQDGRYTARENGGNAMGEFSEAGNVFAASSLYNFDLLVDETGTDTLLSLLVNGVTLIDSQVINLNNLGRYFGFRTHINGSTASSGSDFTASVDNLEIRLVTAIPEPTAIPFVIAAMGCLFTRRRRR